MPARNLGHCKHDPSGPVACISPPTCKWKASQPKGISSWMGRFWGRKVSRMEEGNDGKTIDLVRLNHKVDFCHIELRIVAIENTTFQVP